MGWKGRNMEAELPCTHDLQLDGRTYRENSKIEQTRYGGDADHNSRVLEHGTWRFFRPETLVSHTIQKPDGNGESRTASKDIEQLNREYSTGTRQVNQVQEELNTARKELKSMKTDIHINEAKEAAAKAGKIVFNAVTSVFNVGEIKRQAKEIEELTKENYNLSFKNQNLEGQLRTNTIAMQRAQETADRQIKAQAAKLKPITELFPEMENAGENIEELRTMGIQNNDIRQLLTGKEIYYTGNLYDRDKRKSYPVKSIKIDIAKSRNGTTTIWLNDTHFKTFLQELWNQLQKVLGLNTSKGLYR